MSSPDCFAASVCLWTCFHSTSSSFLAKTYNWGVREFIQGRRRSREHLEVLRFPQRAFVRRDGGSGGNAEDQADGRKVSKDRRRVRDESAHEVLPREEYVGYEGWVREWAPQTEIVFLYLSSFLGPGEGRPAFHDDLGSMEGIVRRISEINFVDAVVSAPPHYVLERSIRFMLNLFYGLDHQRSGLIITLWKARATQGSLNRRTLTQSHLPAASAAALRGERVMWGPGHIATKAVRG